MNVQPQPLPSSSSVPEAASTGPVARRKPRRPCNRPRRRPRKGDYHKTRIEGVYIRLSPSEYEILRHSARAAGQTIPSRMRLLALQEANRLFGFEPPRPEVIVSPGG
jgi:hypothetical protein